MRQIIVGGFYNLLHVSTTEYNVISSGLSWDTVVLSKAGVVTNPGTLRNLRVELDGVPGTGTYTFTLHRAVGEGAFANTTLTCTVAADGTVASDTAHDVSVAAGDWICLECNPDSPDNARYARWTMEFEGDNANESLILCPYGWLGNSSTYYKAIGRPGYYGTEYQAVSVCPTAGKIKDLYVQMTADPGTAPDAYKFTLRKNGSDTTLTCTITADDVSGNDTAHEVTVAAGDLLTVACEPLNSPSVSTAVCMGMTFEADTDGESVIWGGSNNGTNTTDTEYHYLTPWLHASVSAWTSTEAQRYQLVQECIFKKFYVALWREPGAGKSNTVTIRQEGASPASGLAVTISDTDLTGNDTAHTISISDDDSVGIMCVPSGTPQLNLVFWGLVCDTAPPPVNYPISTSPGLTVSATVAYKAAWDRATSPGLTIAETISLAMTYTRLTSADLTAAVSVAFSRNRTIITSTALSISATIDRVVTYTRLTSADLTAAVSVAFSRNRTIITSTALSISATIDRVVTYTRATISNLIVSVAIFAGKNYDIALAAALTVSAAISRVMTYTRATTPGLTVAVSILKSWGIAIVTSANLTVATTILKSRSRTIITSANLTIAATIDRILAFVRTTAPGLTVAVSITIKSAWTIITDTALSVSATVDRTVTYTRGLAANLTASVSLLRTWGTKITTSAGLAVSATVNRVLAYVRSTSPGLTASTTISRAMTHVRATSTGLTTSISMVITGIHRYTVSLAANLIISATVTKRFAYKVSTSANLTVSVIIHYCRVLREIARVAIGRMASSRLDAGRISHWRRRRTCE